MRAIVIASSFSLFACWLAAPSAAADVVITQAMAESGGVTKGDAPGFPIEIRTSGHFILGSDLVVLQHRDGFVVYAPHVTIDLGGFTLRSASHSAPADNGILASASYLTVRNGTIDSFKNGGIYYTTGQTNADVWRIEDVKIRETKTPVYAHGKALLLRNSLIVDNSEGIICGPSCQIEGTQITRSGTSGQPAITINSGSVLGNTIIGYSIGIKGRPGSPAGYGNNTMKNTIEAQDAIPMAPNACTPAC